MKSVRWAIVGMGVFATTATFAVAQSGAFGRIMDAFGSDSDAGMSAADHGASTGSSAGDFHWTGHVASGDVLEIKGINGAISAVPAAGSEIEISASARARKSDPGSVRIEVVEHSGGVTVCAVYPTPRGEDENRCVPGSGGHMNTRDNDVTVDFEVRVPRDVELVARTVNGGISALDLGRDVTANTVNGDIEIATEGFARAETVNGSIEAVMGSMKLLDGASFETVNGSITLDLNDDVDANLSAHWLNGGFESDLPFLLTGRMNRQSATGQLGDGGPELDLQTVNGSIRIR